MFILNFREISKRLNEITFPGINVISDDYCEGCTWPLVRSYRTMITREYGKYGLSQDALDILEEEYKLRDVGVQADIICPKSRTKI